MSNISNTPNPYLPIKAQIMQIIQETTSPELDVKTFRLKLQGGHLCEHHNGLPDEQCFNFLPGQFLEISIPGVGECPIGFASMQTEDGCFDLTIKRTGRVTNRIHALDVGSFVWVRGPFGNTFPLELLEGKDLLIVAGGIGLAPLRPLIQYILCKENRAKYGKVEMLLAARTSEDHCFTYDYDAWRSAGDVTIQQTIDRDEPGWDGLVGFPHELVKNMPANAREQYAVLCGPPIMIKAVKSSLTDMGMSLDKLYTTLEMRMTCGVGKCAKCNIGHNYVCIDGPVFNMQELSTMPEEY